MKLSLALSTAFASAALAQQSAWGQCGGMNWSGTTTCISGYHCTFSNPWYSQCLPDTASSSSAGPQAEVGQCGGLSGSTSTSSTSTSSTSTSTSSTTSPTSTTATSSPTTFATSTTTSASGSSSSSGYSTSTTSTTSSSASPTPSTAPGNSGGVKFVGVNIAGFDFGCGTDGTCTAGAAYPPLSQYGGPDGAAQMTHFVKDTGMNCMRLPVGWQYLVNHVLGGPLDATNFAKYDALVQACVAAGSNCIIDIHNYARWNGAVINQGSGAPTDAQFANLWSQLASKYANQTEVIFGIVNEPHDIPSITTWAATVQTAVKAIRDAGAKSHIILLPGTDYTSAAQFISSGSLSALQTVKNPDGTTTNLVFDIHKYLDGDNSGTSPECVTNAISEAMQPLATALRAIGRKALLSETGGGNTASCEKYLCEEVAYLNANSDVFLGYLGWAAGSFSSSYALSQLPTNVGGVWTDTQLVSKCFKR